MRAALILFRDEIKMVPDRLEGLFRDKYYLTGIRLLISTLKTLDTPVLAPIKATAEIRRSLTKIKNTLHEALIEEIHNHVYLKIHLNEEFDNLSGFRYAPPPSHANRLQLHGQVPR